MGLSEVIDKLRIYNEYVMEKKKKRSVIFLDKPPQPRTCSAVAMSGKRCSRQVACKGFCKTHAHYNKSVV